MQDISTALGKPSHVPPELFWDHSLAEFTSELDDPFMAASRLLDGPPVFYARDCANSRSGWVITRAELLEEAFVDWENFSSEGGMDLSRMLGVDWNLNPVNYDPPRHTAYRKVLLPFFTPRAINHMEAAVRETCDMLMAKLDGRDGCDFVREFSIPFPTYIFLSLMGMPIEMADEFFGLEQALLRGETLEARVGAARQILVHLENHLAEQCKQPTTPLVEAIINAEMDGRKFNDGEILGMFYTFYLGGLDTVYATLSWTMRYIATHPDYQQFMRDNPDKMPKVVDEFLRMFSVVSTQRRVTRDITFHGVAMKENDLVLLPIFVACRDPQFYADPHEAQLGRHGRLLAFASGPHLCLGMHLARRELRIAIESFLGRFANIRIPDGETYKYHAGTTFTMDNLPLVWDRTAE